MFRVIRVLWVEKREPLHHRFENGLLVKVALCNFWPLGRRKTPVQYSWAFCDLVHQYLSWYSTVFTRHSLTLHFMPGRWCTLCLSELVGNSSLLFYTGGLVRPWDWTIQFMCELENKNQELKAAYSVGSALSVSKVAFNGALIEWNKVNALYNTEFFSDHLTINSPAWMAGIHRSAPTSTTVSRAELPISEKTK